MPNLLIILTASYGFMNGEIQGVLVGFFCGIFVDVFHGDVVGFYALIYMYIGYLNGKFSQMYYPEDLKLPLALISVSDLTYGAVCYLLLFLLKGRFDFVWYLMNVILPEVFYTILVSLVLYPVVVKLCMGFRTVKKVRTQSFFR